MQIKRLFKTRVRPGVLVMTVDWVRDGRDVVTRADIVKSDAGHKRYYFDILSTRDGLNFLELTEEEEQKIEISLKEWANDNLE